MKLANAEQLKNKLAEYKKKIEAEKEVLKHFEVVNKITGLSLEQQNEVVARQNRIFIFDVFLDVLTVPEQSKEVEKTVAEEEDADS